MPITDKKTPCVWAVLRKFGARLVASGPKTALQDSYLWLVRESTDRFFDWRYNVDTYEAIPLAKLTILGKDFDYRHDQRRYEQTSVITFKGIMSALPIKHEDYIFIDFGSGKGKVLLMASEYNFKKIIGVEFARELNGIAKRNLSTYSNKNQRCHDIEVVSDDAANFIIPEEKCVIYLFNPFRGAERVLLKVIDNIANSYRANPRKMYFAYLNPVNRNLFDKVAFVRLREVRRFGQGTVAIYESIV